MKRISKKSAVLGVATALVFAVAAYAYLSAAGSGTGTGSVTATTSPLTLTSSGLSFSQLDQTKEIEITASNTNSSPQRPSGLTVTVDEASGCPDGSFTVSDVVQNSSQVAAGTTGSPSTAVIGTANVRFNNLSDTAQNGCLGSNKAVLTLGTGN